jgi:hypothetical protein
MAASMKALIASDGSACADAALDDLKRAGLPGEAEAMVVTVMENSSFCQKVIEGGDARADKVAMILIGPIGKMFDLFPSATLHHFAPLLISAAQLTTTASGAFGSLSIIALIRNRCPSAVTA